jgi:membrane-associated phospholipid phosphatase
MIVRYYGRLISIATITVFIGSMALATGQQQTRRTYEEVWGPKFQPRQSTQPAQAESALGLQSHNLDTTEMLFRWNRIAVDASGVDHTPVPPGDPRVFGEALGPGRSSRAMAIVHIAIFDALNAIEGGFRSYTGLPRFHSSASKEAAIAKAAHDSLVFVFPSQTAAFDAALADDLDDIPNGTAKTNGIAVGRAAADAIIDLRTGDGSEIPEPLVGIDHITSDLPGRWRQDPISLIPLALGAHWKEVDPFVMNSATQFRAPAPPAISSVVYAFSFAEVFLLGGDGITTPTFRNAEQTRIGIYWAYDATPALCAPPRLYNQIATRIAGIKQTRGIALARLLALVNVALADAGIAIWESKYFYDYWRPVTGIREASPGTGPTGAGDGNPLTRADPTFSPLGAPASNEAGVNFTPPFPAYPSGHAGFGGALFQTLRRFYGTDRVPFTFVSDEFNGITRDSEGNVRPLIPRSFRSFSEAEEENGQSRIYLGIHWSFDKTEGIAQGRRVANFVFDRRFRRIN